MRTRCRFIVAAAVAATSCGQPRDAAQIKFAAAAAQPRPNIVMVLVDDMRWDEMRIAGHPFVDTPHMDRLAREGARFLNAFATTPLCSPSHASFLTGQYAHTNGIVDNTARPSHDLRAFPLELQRAGYRTAFFGKWHMGNDDSPRPATPGEMVLSIDLAPTLLELAGLSAGAERQGRSLVPLFQQAAPEWHSSFLVEYYSDTVFPRIKNMGYVAVRTSRHKYIHYRELEGMDELYDLQTDPYEKTNLNALTHNQRSMRCDRSSGICWNRRSSPQRPSRHRTDPSPLGTILG